MFSFLLCLQTCDLLYVQDGESRQISLDVFQIDNEHDMEQGMKLMNDVSNTRHQQT